MNQGIFITIEGGEGAGKSSLITMIHSELVNKGYEVLVTREPGGIEIAEKIRSIILNPSHIAMDGRTEALLYAAARRQHLVQKVIPALSKGYIVLCDRFIDSSLAYQGYARGLGMEEVYQINRFATEDAMPQLTLYLDIDPRVGLARVHANSDREINRLDLENLAFHDQVREGYLKLTSMYSDRIVTLDAARVLDDIFQESIYVIIQHIEQRNL